MPARLTATLSALALSACTAASRHEPPEPEREPPPAAAPSSPEPAAALEAKPRPAPATAPAIALPPTGEDILAGKYLVGTELELDALVEALTSAPLTNLRPVGTTSTVFRARLKGPNEAAFKTRTKKRPSGPAAEVAAYRMARLLGLTNVPPAVSRSIPLERVRANLAPDAVDQWPEISDRLEVRAGLVQGAVIHWLPRLAHPGLDHPAGIARWSAWLSIDGAIADAERNLASSVSSMLVFDYLIGNWDRWSGGNVKGDPNGRYLYFRDHDAAFPLRLAPRMHRKLVDRLLQANRFSRRLYERLRALTREQFEAELARDPAGKDLLSEGQITHVFDRQRTIVSHVGALIEEHGAEHVLVFP